jgi:hypothetical protein
LILVIARVSLHRTHAAWTWFVRRMACPRCVRSSSTSARGGVSNLHMEFGEASGNGVARALWRANVKDASGAQQVSDDVQVYSPIGSPDIDKSFRPELIHFARATVGFCDALIYLNRKADLACGYASCALSKASSTVSA